MKIIDIHTHPRLNWDDPEKEMGEIIDFARSFDIKKMFLLGDVLHFGPEPSRKEVMKINDQTMDLLEKFPRFLEGFCSCFSC